jgi:prepilin peptidase CpaA
MDTTSFGYMLVLSILLGTGAVMLLTASLSDLALRLLPNWTSAGTALIGIALRLLDGTIFTALAAAFAVFCAAYFCWRRGWIGGGDVKLLAACALLVPPELVPALIILTTWGGGVLALLYIGLGRLLPREPGTTAPRARRANAPRRGRPWLALRLWRVECRRILRRAPLPYGCVIAGAALILLLGPTGPLGK